MNEFLDRLRNKWNTAEKLQDLLVEFFDSDSPKTLTNLYAWLNTDWMDIETKKAKGDNFRHLLDVAEAMCEEWVVNHGFENDRSFSKWYLEKYHNKEVSTNSSDVTWIYKLDD